MKIQLLEDLPRLCGWKDLIESSRFVGNEDRFQEKLAALEDGNPLADCQEGLDNDEADLLQMAASLREFQPPSRKVGEVMAQRANVTRTAEEQRTEADCERQTIAPWQNASGDPSADPAPTLALPPSGQPITKNQKCRYWVLAAIAAQLLFFLCLGSTGMFLYNQFLAKPKESPVDGSVIEKSPTSSVRKTSATKTLEQAKTPT